MTAPEQHAQETSARVRATLDAVFVWLHRLDGEFRQLQADAPGRQRPSQDDLSGLQRSIFDRLEADSDLLAGTGVILDENALPGRSHRVEWWQNQPAAPPKFLQITLDPDAVDFYAYTSAEWFAVPRDQLSRVVTGPYVDYGGTNEYILTLSIPVLTEGRFLGVATADLHIAAFEALLMNSRRPHDPPTALVNRTGRVVAASRSSELTGTLLRDRRPLVRSAVDVASGAVGLPWEVVVLAPSEQPHATD